MKPQTSATLTTPGPWEARPEKSESGSHVAGRGPQVVCGNKVIADIRSGYTKVQRDEAQANARLFAAVLELLASVNEFLAMRQAVINVGGAKGPLDQQVIEIFAEMQNGIVERAEAAVKKARGTE